MNKDLSIDGFCQHIDKHIFETSVDQKNQFKLFLNLLLEWNLKINLISRNEKNIVDRHFLNSVCIAHYVKFKPEDRIADLGSGGGFPAIILKILFPDSYFVLVDSVRKKTDFLKYVINELHLKNIDVVNARAESISSHKHYNSSFDYVTARAVTQLDGLIGLSRPFLNENGKMIFLKGKNYATEITTASFKTMHIEKYFLRSVSESQDGVLLVISE